MQTLHLYRWIIGSGLVLTFLFVAVGLTGGAGASTYYLPSGVVPLDQEYLVVQGPGDLFRPTVADGSLLVWYARGTDDLDVFGLRLDDDGLGLDEPFLIASGNGNQALPAVAAGTEDGGYLVAWHQQNSQDADVYARYLTAGGHPRGAAFIVAASQGDQLRPAVAYVPAVGAFLVVWQDNRLGGAPDVYARLVSITGGGLSLLGDEFVVSATSGGQFIPDVACQDMQPRCLVVWQDDRNEERSYTDILGRLVQADEGRTIGDEVEVAVEADYQYSPVVVFNPVSAEYLVVWDDDISARRISRSGHPRGKRVDISLESFYQYKPAVAVGADGAYLIVWEDLRNWNTRGADVYGQWLSRTGRPLGPNFALSADLHNQYSPAMVSNQGAGERDFFIVWEDNRARDARLALYGRWLSRGDGSE